MGHNDIRVYENSSPDGAGLHGEPIVNNFFNGEPGPWSPPSAGGYPEHLHRHSCDGSYDQGALQTYGGLADYAGQFMPPYAYAGAGPFVDQGSQSYVIPDPGMYAGSPDSYNWSGHGSAQYAPGASGDTNCNGSAGEETLPSPKELIDYLASPAGQADQQQLFNYATDHIGDLAQNAQQIPDGTIDLSQPIQSLEAATGIKPQGQAGKLLSDLASASKSGSDQYQIDLKNADTFGPIHLSKTVKFQEHDVNGALQLDHIEGATVHVAGSDVPIDSLKLYKGTDGKPQFTAQGSHFTVSGEINSLALSKGDSGQVAAAIDVKSVDVNAFGHEIKVPNWVRQIF